MKHLFYILTLMFCLSANAQEITWKQHAIDGHRTGVTQKGAGQTEAAMGKVKRLPKRYLAPNGSRYRRGTARKVAKIIIEAQDSMAFVKEIIAHSPRVMEKKRPESALSNWYIDALMKKTSEYTGKRAHWQACRCGICQFRWCSYRHARGRHLPRRHHVDVPIQQHPLLFHPIGRKPIGDLQQHRETQG